MTRTVLLCLLAMHLTIFATAQKGDSFSSGPEAEFVGPFQSWLNVKKDFGAKGNGKTDDTGALQAALDAAGTDPKHTVVYLPAGNYRIQSTLTINNRINVSVVGEDPSVVSITWFGRPHGTLLSLNGTAYSKFNRITFNGRGIADVAVEQSWDGKKPHFDTANEYADDVFTDVGFGIRGGAQGNGFAETSILRDRFLRNSQAGISLGNFNALDIWVRQCYFQDCAYGVTNIFGAGNFKVYHCQFRHSLKSDMQIGNTGEFSVRGNTSVGSAQFFIGGFTRNPACITLEGNTILDPLNTLAISVSDQGPVMFINNTIRSSPNANGVVVRFGTDSYCEGNTFSVENALIAGNGSIIRNTRVVTPSDLNQLKSPVLPGSPHRVNRTIFEVPPNADAATIQAIINRAAKLQGQRPTIHFPYGTYPIRSTLLLPPGCDLRLAGDGFGDQRGTTLAWTGDAGGVLIRLRGPSHATLTDLTLKGTTATTNLLIDQADQPDARLTLCEFHQAGGQTGLVANGTVHLQITGQDVAFSGLKTAVKIIGGRMQEINVTAQTVFYSGAESDNVVSHQVSGSGRLFIQDTWYEGGAKSIYASLSGNSYFAATGSHIAVMPNTDAITVQGFSGKALFAADDLTGRLNCDGMAPRGQLLVLGILAEQGPFVTGTVAGQNNTNLLLNRGRTQGSTLLNGGSFRLDDSGDLGSWSPAELMNPRQPARNKQQKGTRVLLIRVMSLDGSVGLDAEPGS